MLTLTEQQMAFIKNHKKTEWLKNIPAYDPNMEDYKAELRNYMIDALNLDDDDDTLLAVEDCINENITRESKNVFVYSASDMINILKAIECKDESIIADLSKNDFEGSVIDGFLSELKSSGSGEFDSLVHVFPDYENSTVTFAKKDFLLSVIDGGEERREAALKAIAFRYIQDDLPEGLKDTEIASFSSRFVSDDVLEYKTDTMRDVRDLEFSDYFYPSIGSHVVAEVLLELNESPDLHSSTYLAVIDSIIDQISDKYAQELKDVQGLIFDVIVKENNKQNKIKDGFILTDPDTNQWCKKVSDTVYELEEERQSLFRDDETYIYRSSIDLNDYTDEEIEDTAVSYNQGGLAEVKALYGEEWPAIIAEMIFEGEIDEGTLFPPESAALEEPQQANKR
jgi:hypothetical protein